MNTDIDEPTTTRDLVLRLTLALDGYARLLRALPDEDRRREDLGTVDRASGWGHKFLDTTGMDISVGGHKVAGVLTSVEPAANTITVREAPPLSYTVLAGGLTPMGDPVDCYQVPRVGETLVVGDHRPYVTAVHWVTGREAEVRVSDTYAMEAI